MRLERVGLRDERSRLTVPSAYQRAFKRKKSENSSCNPPRINYTTHMTKLYTLTLENVQGEIRNMQVAAKNVTHALERLDSYEELVPSDKLKGWSYEYIQGWHNSCCPA